MDGFKMWEGVEIWFHVPSPHEGQKCKSSGCQEKGHHDDWCSIGKQQTKKHSPQKPSFSRSSDEKNDDETTSDKSCNGCENEESLSKFFMCKKTKYFFR